MDVGVSTYLLELLEAWALALLVGLRDKSLFCLLNLIGLLELLLNVLLLLLLLLLWILLHASCLIDRLEALKLWSTVVNIDLLGKLLILKLILSLSGWIKSTLIHVCLSLYALSLIWWLLLEFLHKLLLTLTFVLEAALTLNRLKPLSGLINRNSWLIIAIRVDWLLELHKALIRLLYLVILKQVLNLFLVIWVLLV